MLRTSDIESNVCQLLLRMIYALKYMPRSRGFDQFGGRVEHKEEGGQAGDDRHHEVLHRNRQEWDNGPVDAANRGHNFWCFTLYRNRWTLPIYSFVEKNDYIDPDIEIVRAFKDWYKRLERAHIGKHQAS
jgi:hypothetical protein